MSSFDKLEAHIKFSPMAGRKTPPLTLKNSILLPMNDPPEITA